MSRRLWKLISKRNRACRWGATHEGATPLTNMMKSHTELHRPILKGYGNRNK
jgi:hypothetical protein